MTLKIGDKAPQFSLLNQDGKTRGLTELRGKTTLIYFYPKDETPGCTIQACKLRDNFEDLQANGMDVIGVSKDNVASHSKFQSRHHLPFDVLADTEHKMNEAYGAWKEYNMFGRKYYGTARSAVIIGPKLTILALWPKIQPLKTVPKVMDWIKAHN